MNCYIFSFLPFFSTLEYYGFYVPTDSLSGCGCNLFSGCGSVSAELKCGSTDGTVCKQGCKRNLADGWPNDSALGQAKGMPENRLKEHVEKFVPR